MLNWMASIHGHHIHHEIEGGLCGYPRMYCIGTHGDVLITNEKKKAVLNELESNYKNKAFIELVKETLIIDNTTSDKKNVKIQISLSYIELFLSSHMKSSLSGLQLAGFSFVK